MNIEYLYLNEFDIYEYESICCLLQCNQHKIETILRTHLFLNEARKQSIRRGIHIYVDNGLPLYNSYLREYLHDYKGKFAKFNLLYSRKIQFRSIEPALKSRKIYLVNLYPEFYFHTIELLAKIWNEYLHTNKKVLEGRMPNLFITRHVIADIL